MRTIRISDDVWQEIAKRGKFGETEDEVLKRVFRIESDESAAGIVAPTRQSRLGADRMHAKVYHDQNAACLRVHFHGSGAEEKFELPGDRSDKRAIRATLESALDFGERNGASKGQLFAIRKALTEAGYHLTK